MWLKTFCQVRLNQYESAVGGTNETLPKNTGVITELDNSIEAHHTCAYLLYNRGCLKAQQLDYAGAIADFTKALEAEANLPEAYYNRGICRLKAGQTADGIADLSKAGEQGLYAAYSIIKKYRNNGTK